MSRYTLSASPVNPYLIVNIHRLISNVKDLSSSVDSLRRPIRFPWHSDGHLWHKLVSQENYLDSRDVFRSVWFLLWASFELVACLIVQLNNDFLDPIVRLRGVNLRLGRCLELIHRYHLNCQKYARKVSFIWAGKRTDRFPIGYVGVESCSVQWPLIFSCGNLNNRGQIRFRYMQST